MKMADDRYESTERLLRRVRPRGPSLELQERVTGAAAKAWKETPAEVPWQIPLRRLAISAAAAVVIVSTANYFSNCAVGRWQADQPVVARAPVADSDETWEAPYDPFVQHLVAVRRSRPRNPAAVIDSVEKLREVFKEIEERIDEVETPEPGGFKGRLIPAGSNRCWQA